MPSPKLPTPEKFEDVQLLSPELEKLLKHLPDRAGEKKSYLDTIVRNYKFRIMVCTIAFLAMVGGTVAAALFISNGMQRISKGRAAISALFSLPASITTPTPLQSTVTQIMMTSVVTDWITIPVSQLRSTIYAIATAPPAPAVSRQAGDIGVTCGSLASQPEQRQ